MLPLDVINRSGGGTVPMGELWILFSMWIVLQVVLIIPFMLAWYDISAETFGQRLWLALKAEFWVILIFFVISGACYYQYGVALVPYRHLMSVLVDDVVTLPKPEDAVKGMCLGLNCFKGIAKTLPVKVSFPVYMVAIMSLFGWLFLVLFGGIGLITLPMDLVFAFKDRPHKMELEEFAKLRLLMRERTEKLLTFGKTLEAETSGRSMTIQQRNLYNKFKASTYGIHDDWEKVKAMYAGEGVGSILYPLQLGLGMVGYVISAMWLLHLIIYSLTKAATGKAVSPFLNSAFVGGERFFPMITLALYSIFVLWLLWCVLRGYVKIGLRAVTVPLHPLKKKGTRMNSMLVNTALVVCTSLAVITFTSLQLDGYLRLTASNMIFVIMLAALKGLAPAWIVYQYLLFVIVAITGVYFFMFPREANREEELSADLEEMMHPTEKGGRRCLPKCCKCVVS